MTGERQHPLHLTRFHQTCSLKLASYDQLKNATKEFQSILPGFGFGHWGAGCAQNPLGIAGAQSRGSLRLCWRSSPLWFSIFSSLIIVLLSQDHIANSWRMKTNQAKSNKYFMPSMPRKMPASQSQPALVLFPRVDGKTVSLLSSRAG